MLTPLLLLLMAALPGLTANTTLHVNTAITGSDSGNTCLTNETDDSADSACTSLHAAESKLPSDITTGGDQGVWTILCERSVADTTAVTFAGTTAPADTAPMDFTTDIDGVAHTAPWGIGADEYAPSVGRRKRAGAIQ